LYDGYVSLLHENKTTTSKNQNKSIELTVFVRLSYCNWTCDTTATSRATSNHILIISPFLKVKYIKRFSVADLLHRVHCVVWIDAKLSYPYLVVTNDAVAIKKWNFPKLYIE